MSVSRLRQAIIFSPGPLLRTHGAQADFEAVCVSCDAGSGNVLLLKHLETLHPDRFFLTVFCCQHRTAAVLKVVTQSLGLYGPCFCASKAFYKGRFMGDIRTTCLKELSSRLEVRAHAGGVEEHTWPLGAAILQLGYVEGEDGARGDRKALADAFLRFFPRPWGAGLIVFKVAFAPEVRLAMSGLQGPRALRLLGERRAWSLTMPGGRIVHLCAGRDCCATLEDTVRQAERLLDKVVFRALPTPSENKWTKMEPAGSNR